MSRLSMLSPKTVFCRCCLRFQGHPVGALRAVGIAAIIVVLSALPSSNETAAKTFRFANSTQALTMDPHGALVVFTEMIQGYVYEGLVRINKDNQFEPSLAVSYGRV
jgi:hypothetical protein